MKTQTLRAWSRILLLLLMTVHIVTWYVYPEKIENGWACAHPFSIFSLFPPDGEYLIRLAVDLSGTFQQLRKFSDIRVTGDQAGQVRSILCQGGE
jgi:hypothetical protein